MKKVRIRPSRRIDLRGQIRIYDEDLAIINNLLLKANNGLFVNQQIRFYALLPQIDSSGEPSQKCKSLIIITNEYLLLMNLFNFFDMHKQKKVQQSLVLSEKLKHIVNYSVRKRPSLATPVKQSKAEDEKFKYIHAMYFMSIIFKKQGAKPKGHKSIQKPKLPKSDMIFENQFESHDHIKSPQMPRIQISSQHSMAPPPRTQKQSSRGS